MLGFTSGELLSGTMAANILRRIQNLHLYTSFLLPILFILLDTTHDFRLDTTQAHDGDNGSKTLPHQGETTPALERRLDESLQLHDQEADTDVDDGNGICTAGRSGDAVFCVHPWGSLQFLHAFWRRPYP